MSLERVLKIGSVMGVAGLLMLSLTACRGYPDRDQPYDSDPVASEGVESSF